MARSPHRRRLLLLGLAVAGVACGELQRLERGRGDAGEPRDAGPQPQGDAGPAPCPPEGRLLWEDFRDLLGWSVAERQGGEVTGLEEGAVRLLAPPGGGRAALSHPLPPWPGPPAVLVLELAPKELGETGSPPSTGDRVVVRLAGGGQRLELLLTAGGTWLQSGDGLVAVGASLPESAEVVATRVVWGETTVEVSAERLVLGTVATPPTRGGEDQVAIEAVGEGAGVEVTLRRLDLACVP